MINFPVSYQNGGFNVSIEADGTKVRSTISDDPPAHPEHMDLKITNWCDANCSWCHEQSNKEGKHGDVNAILDLLAPLPAGVEVAIGGGDPLSHPEFDTLIQGLTDQGIICNVTVNGKHFDRHIANIEKFINNGWLHGVGISFQGKIPKWDYPGMVLHLIAGVHKPEVLDQAESRLKVLLLGYKKHGRGAGLFDVIGDEIVKNIKQWKRELFVVAQEHNLSFDNLAIEQLDPKRLFASLAAYESRFMGEEGSFGLYVDAVEQTFALSSYSKERSTWSDIVSMFRDVRESQGFIV